MGEGAGPNGADALPLLSVRHLTMRFGGLTAVSDVSFEALGGQITALIGPNGAGKTTVFNCITGFYKPSSGRIALSIDGRASSADADRLMATGRRSAPDRGLYLLERMPDFEIAAKARVARTFQNIRLFGGMSVLENLIVARHGSLHRASGYGVLGLLAAPAYGRALRESVGLAQAWLKRIGLIERADDPAGALPYGAQRRLEIARGMCMQPALLCLDEPAAGLNPRESAELTELLASIPCEHGAAVLLIEHDMSVVMEISDHIVVLEHGQRIADGPPEAICNDEKVIAAYLGVAEEEVATVEAEVAAEAAGAGQPGSNRPGGAA